MLEDLYPVRWAGRQAVVALPEHIGVSNAGQVHDELLSVINRGATRLVADLTATISCDYAGAGSRPPGRVPGTRPRPERDSGHTAPRGGTPRRAAGRRDGTIATASARLEDMFGYGHGELPGRTVQSLVPEALRAANGVHHSARMRSPTEAGAPLAGLRKDGTTFPARVSLIPVTVTAGQFTLAVIRDLTPARHDDSPARDAATAGQEHVELLDAVITGIFRAGLSLQGAAGLPAETCAMPKPRP